MVEQPRWRKAVTMLMDTLVCTAPGRLDLLRRPVPVRAGGEVLVRVRRVGVCGTDMHIFRGTQPYLSYPRVMGHEVSGEVAEADPDSGLVPGDTVYLIPYLSCGTCVACRAGKTNCCVETQVLGVHRDGGMADYIAVPRSAVVPIADLGLDAAAMIEFLAIGAHAVRRAAIPPGGRTLVVGAGPIGVAAAIFGKIAGADVTAIDSRPDRLAFCRDRVGVDHTVIVGPSDHSKLAAITDGEFFDVVIDATGSPTAMEANFARVAHGGSYVLVSVVDADITFNDPEFHKRETTLLASRNATRADFAYVVAMMRAGRIPLAALATHRTSLAGLADALPLWMKPATGVIKGLVEL